MAELYIARQESVGGFEKNVVVKLLQPRYAENPRVVRMFLDEARLAAKLNHPSIVHVYDVADDDGIKYIAMEYIHGETLTDIIRRGIAVNNYLPLEHAVHVVSQTAAGLAYAHTRRESDERPLCIVHRDVSPSNVMVSYEGQTKIVDFGIARIQDQIREESGMRPGKASYMSPEQVRGEAADYRSDIFSLGIILYETTLARRLWRGPADVVMKRILTEKVPPPTYVKRDYPAALELIVMKALEKRPEDRYQSAEEMRNELEEFLDEEGFRTGNRRMALYLKDVFAPAAATAADSGPVSGDAGAFGDANLPGQQPQQLVADDSEELNFDRRAPLAMRLEAAPSSAGSGSSRSNAQAAVRPPAAAGALTRAADRSASNGTAGLSTPGLVAPGSPGGSPSPPNAAPSSWSLGPAPGSSLSAPSPSVSPAAMPDGDSVELQLPHERKGGLLLLAAVFLLGLLAMVFVVLK
jgi:serine/threonine protein kinase